MDLLSPYIRFKGKEFDTSRKTQYGLTIQISLGGFSFVVNDAEQGRIVALRAYNNVDTLAHVKDAVSEFCADNGLDTASFAKVTCVVDDANYAVVPSGLFGQEQAEACLDFCNDNQGNTVITEHVPLAGCDVVYGVGEGLVESLSGISQKHETRHAAAILIGDLLLRNKGLRQYVNVRQSDIDVMVADDDKLLFYNSFNFKGIDDFLYFIVTVMRQYGSPEQMKLCFCGMVMPDSAVMNLVNRYVRNVGFLESALLPADIDVPRHYFYVPLAII